MASSSKKGDQGALFSVSWPVVAASSTPDNPPESILQTPPSEEDGAHHPPKPPRKPRKGLLGGAGAGSLVAGEWARTREHACSVSALNQRLKGLVEEGLHGIYVLGELVDVKQAASGHWYFSLRDEQTSMRCIMFRGGSLGLPFALQDGLKVLVRGNMSVYAPRGECQLQVITLALQGEGERQRLLEQRKQALSQEGLFAAERKQSLPAFARGVGVVTSAHGAAFHDVCQVIKRRFASMPIILCPASVQGTAAVLEVCQGIQTLNQHAAAWGLDVLIVTRGGGAREDLAAFDSEEVVRAVVASRLPVISAVGHETDTTLVDHAADVRAPTPSAAAELAVPVRADLAQVTADLLARLYQHQQQHQRNAYHQWQGMHARLRSPQSQLAGLAARFEQLHARLHPLGKRFNTHPTLRLQALLHRLNQANPTTALTQHRARVHRLQEGLTQAMMQHLGLVGQRLALGQHALQNIGPLKVLARGYAALQSSTGQRISSAKQVALGQRVRLLLHDGSLEATVDKNTPFNTAHPIKNDAEP